MRHRVSMERTSEEKIEERLKNEFPPSISSMPDVPPGLCIALTEAELEKLGMELDDGVEIGDTIHMDVFAKITGIKCEDTTSGRSERLEMAITDILSFEDENTEEPPAKGKK